MDDRMLAQLRRLSHVPRWVVVPTVQQQNVAMHSFNVIALTLWLMEFHKEGKNSAFVGGVAGLALTHDADEALYGDVPGPAKKAWASERAPTMSQQGIVLKVADILEMIAFLGDETAMGNVRVASLVKPLLDDVKVYWHHFEKSDEYIQLTFDGMMKKFRDATSPHKHPLMEYLSHEN